MAVYELANEAVSIQVHSHGAELKSLKKLSTGTEYLWKADPAFNCPVEEGKKQTDYVIRFDKKDQVISTRLGNAGLVTDEKDVYHLQNGVLPVTENLFDNDALIIEHNQAKKVALCDKEGNAYLTVTMEAPLFGIWSPPKKNAPFICIEPWYGRCDHECFEGELNDREWGNRIAPGEIWKASYQVRV